MEINVDAEGFLANRDDWTDEICRELIKRDDMEATDQIMGFVTAAREMYEKDGSVPPIRKFAKAMGVTSKDLYDIFHKGPMKIICKWGALPKPTGCV